MSNQKPKIEGRRKGSLLNIKCSDKDSADLSVGPSMNRKTLFGKLNNTKTVLGIYHGILHHPGIFGDESRLMESLDHLLKVRSESLSLVLAELGETGDYRPVSATLNSILSSMIVSCWRADAASGEDPRVSAEVIANHFKKILDILPPIPDAMWDEPSSDLDLTLAQARAVSKIYDALGSIERPLEGKRAGARPYFLGDLSMDDLVKRFREDLWAVAEEVTTAILDEAGDAAPDAHRIAFKSVLSSLSSVMASCIESGGDRLRREISQASKTPELAQRIRDRLATNKGEGLLLPMVNYEVGRAVWHLYPSVGQRAISGSADGPNAS